MNFNSDINAMFLQPHSILMLEGEAGDEVGRGGAFDDLRVTQLLEF